MKRVIVRRSDVTHVEVDVRSLQPLDEGQVRLGVDRFALTSNNISYALFGDALGYWAYHPIDDRYGCVPAWGFADVIESRHPQLAVGRRVFGFLPMATEFVVRPTDVSELAFSDSSDHRTGLHSWYNRHYLCDVDPLYDADHEDLQAAMWALFMTGWALAEQLAETATSVVVSSASSKTALSLAWSLRATTAGCHVVGVTSASNRQVVEATGAYDRVGTYDDITLADVVGPAAYVDAAGSPAVTERVHAALGERLTDSVVLGATHQGAGPAEDDLVGPTPRFFFIPDVAEQLAAGGLADHHHRFAAAWHEFLPWLSERLRVEVDSGVDAIVAGYRTALAGDVGPDVVRVFSW